MVEELLSSAPQRAKTFLDCTFGQGGHTLAFLKKFPDLQIVALDQDSTAIRYGKSLKQIPQNQIQFLNSNFHDGFEDHLKFDIILMDLGVSSLQLGRAERGFSFYQDGPLDMRMDQRQIQTASDIVNGFSKEDLVELFKTYGEIKNPYPVVEILFQQRRQKKIQTTKEFVTLILRKTSWNLTRRHPATPYFLALRMKVNNELEGLKKSLPSLLSKLNPKGHFMVITFHSLEDRIVKQAFKSFVQKKEGLLLNKKVMRPSQAEREKNIRSRSAKLRIFVKKG